MGIKIVIVNIHIVINVFHTFYIFFLVYGKIKKKKEAFLNRLTNSVHNKEPCYIA